MTQPVHEMTPPFPWVVLQHAKPFRCQVNVVLVQELEEAVCTQDLDNTIQNQIAALASEERSLLEYHGGEGAAKGPHVN